MAFAAKLRNNKKVIGNAGWLIAEKLGILGVGLITSIFVARYLEPTGFGVISFGLAIVAFVDPVASLGMNSILSREIVNKNQPEGTVIATAITFRGIAGILSLIFVSLLLVFVLDNESPEVKLMVVLASSAKVFSAFGALRFWFEANTNAKHLVKYSIAQTIIFSLLKLLAVYYESPLESFIYIFAMEVAAGALILIFPYIFNRVELDRWHVDFAYGVKLVKQSSWLLLSGIASIIYLKIDQVMLGSMRDAASVGIYAVASRFSEVWYFIPGAIMSSLFPSLIRAKENDEKSYDNKLQTSLDILFWIAFAIATIMTIISDKFIFLLYGEEYMEASNILAIHVWAGLFVFMRAVLSKWLIIEHILSFSLITHGVGALVNVALNLLLIPQYGGEGAALATLVSYASAAWLSLFIFSRTREMGVKMLKAPFAPLRHAFKMKG